jgi:hypothetical protein
LSVCYFDEHIDSKIVSTTDFTTIALALADDAVRDAIAGDWVKIAGKFNIISKSDPRATSDFIEIGSSTWESITGRPLEITDAQVTNGVGTDEVLMTTTKLKTAIVAHSTPLPTRVTTTEKNARNGTTIRSWTVKDIADMDTGGGGAILPPEITDTQVTSGTGTTTVLITLVTSYGVGVGVEYVISLIIPASLYEWCFLVSTLAGSSPTRSMLFIEPLVL